MHPANLEGLRPLDEVPCTLIILKLGLPRTPHSLTNLKLTSTESRILILTLNRDLVSKRVRMVTTLDLTRCPRQAATTVLEETRLYLPAMREGLMCSLLENGEPSWSRV